MNKPSLKQRLKTFFYRHLYPKRWLKRKEEIRRLRRRTHELTMLAVAEARNGRLYANEEIERTLNARNPFLAVKPKDD